MIIVPIISTTNRFMKIKWLISSLLCASFFNVLLAQTNSYIKTSDGVTVFTDPFITGTSNAVKLEVVADNMIRVLMINLFIPVFNIVVYLLAAKRLLPFKYRELLFDYGFVFLVLQIIAVIVTYYFWMQKRFRMVAIIIFVIYILLGVFSDYIFPTLYLND